MRSVPPSVRLLAAAVAGTALAGAVAVGLTPTASADVREVRVPAPRQVSFSRDPRPCVAAQRNYASFRVAAQHNRSTANFYHSHYRIPLSDGGIQELYSTARRQSASATTVYGYLTTHHCL